MSLREIWVSCKYIEVRTHNEFAMRARVHGVKIPLKNLTPRDQETRNTNFSPEEDAAVEKAMQRAMARAGGGFVKKRRG